MKTNKDLEQELVQAGASAEEASVLTKLAAQLRHVYTPPPKFIVRRRTSWEKLALAGGISAVTFLFAGGGVVAMAQASQPGSTLYPVERFSEKVAERLHPSFTNRVMMRRANEIDQLVSSNGSEDTVLDEVHEYNAAFAKARLDQATRDYCADHLSHAASLASGGEQAAIQEALKHLGYKG